MGKHTLKGKIWLQKNSIKMALCWITQNKPAKYSQLEDLLSTLAGNGYTHVLGLFLSSGISGFYQNIQFLKMNFLSWKLPFPDSKITSAPLGIMVQSALNWAEAGLDFNEISEELMLRLTELAPLSWLMIWIILLKVVAFQTELLF